MSAENSNASSGPERWLKWGFVGPTLLFLIAFNVFPLGYNLVLGFTNAELVGRGGHDGVGGANYARVFSDPQFADAIRLTATVDTVSARPSAATVLGPEPAPWRVRSALG